MKINVKEIIGDRATDMKQGDQIYDLITQNFEKKEKVELDFSGMITVLSTFLNNAVGALYKDYSSDYLNANLKLIHLNDEDMFVLEQVLKRAKEFYANEAEVTEVLDQKMFE